LSGDRRRRLRAGNPATLQRWSLSWRAPGGRTELLAPAPERQLGVALPASPPAGCGHFIAALVENNDDGLMQEVMP